MITPRQAVQFTDTGEAADLAAFLGRLLHYDRAAVVRLQAAGTTLGVFGRPSSFEVLAIRTGRLAKPYEQGLDETLDLTVSAGDLLESIDEQAATAIVPRPVTGPPWAGVLPPRGGWRQEPGLPSRRALLGLVAGVVAEFRTRTEELGTDGRTRAQLDQIGRDLWSRPVGGTGLPVRAAHAAYALGFLGEPRPQDAEGMAQQDPVPSAPRAAGPPDASPAGASVALFAAGAWLRLRTPYGSIAVRRSGTGMLSVLPVRTGAPPA